MEGADIVTAYNRALSLLTAIPEGSRLARGESVRVRSSTFASLEYEISFAPHDQIRVYCGVDFIGSLCIVSETDSPSPDVLYTKVQLCKYDERALWTLGNLTTYNDRAVDFKREFRRLGSNVQQASTGEAGSFLKWWSTVPSAGRWLVIIVGGYWLLAVIFGLIMRIMEINLRG